MDPSMSSAVPAGFSAAFASLVLPLLSSLLIGALVTWGLQGVLCVQVYNYYLSFPNDPTYMKVTVYLAMALELAQTLMVTSDTYKIYAEGYGNLLGLDQLHLLWLTLPILGGLVGLLCHLVFAYRISILSESRSVGAAIGVISLAATISSFLFGGKIFIAGTLSQTVQIKNIYLVCGLWNGFGALCDVVIAGCMSFYLTRNQTGFKNTDLLITRIVRMTIETGVATATASISSAVLFVGFREKLDVSVYFVVPAIMITKLYSITILATFNNRPHAVGGPPPLPDVEHGLGHGSGSGSGSFEMRKSSSPPPPTGITFNRTTVVVTGKNPTKRPRSKKGIIIPNNNSEIRIGRTVVQEVWTDPIEQYEMTSDATGSLKGKDGDYVVPAGRPDSIILKEDVVDSASSTLCPSPSISSTPPSS